MVGPSLSKPRPDRRSTPASSDDLEQLVRDIARQAMVGDIPASLHELDGEIIELVFDVELDGTRWLVARARPKPIRVAAIISPREREIARMISKGYPNKTIAAVLEISTWTVSTYLRRIFAKLGVSSRAAMVARLIEEGSLIECGGCAEPSSPRIM
jgi:DNA-binding CsgD family transcriptional regulator